MMAGYDEDGQLKNAEIFRCENGHPILWRVNTNGQGYRHVVFYKDHDLKMVCAMRITDLEDHPESQVITGIPYYDDAKHQEYLRKQNAYKRQRNRSPVGNKVRTTTATWYGAKDSRNRTVAKGYSDGKPMTRSWNERSTGKPMTTAQVKELLRDALGEVIE